MQKPKLLTLDEPLLEMVLNLVGDAFEKIAVINRDKGAGIPIVEKNVIKVPEM